MPLSLRRKVDLGYGLSLLILAIIGLVCYSSLQAMLAGLQVRRDTNILLHAVEHLGSDLLAAQTHQRGFLLSGRPSDFECYREARLRVARDLDVLSPVMVRCGADAPFVQELRGLASQALLELQSAIDARRARQPLAATPTATGSEGPLLASLQEVLHSLERQGLDSLEAAHSKAETRGSATVMAILVGLCAALLLVGRSRALVHGDLRLRELAEAALAAAEQRYRALNGELEQRIAARTAQLTESNAALRRRNEENHLFVYAVSHDLREPLVNLQGFSQELERTCLELHDILLGDENVPANLRERCREILDRAAAGPVFFIKTSVTRLSRSIDALLKLSRVERVPFNPQRLDMTALVGRIVTSLRATIDGKGATVQLDELPAAWGDPIAVEQALASLIENALKYLEPTRQGRVEIGFSWSSPPGDSTFRPSETSGGPTPEPVLLDLSTGSRTGRSGDPRQQLSAARATGRSVSFFVKDNGRGIPERYRGKVFSAFQRFHSDVAGGEGVGLAFVRRIVDRHGGATWFHSEEGRGSTFFLSLPASQLPCSTEGLDSGPKEIAS